MKTALAIAALAFCVSGAQAQPASGWSAEERLEGIRAGLVQAALQGATRVDSVAWIDGQGVLREGSSFRSGMQVRGVQVLGYLRDSAGQPQAQLKLPNAKPTMDGGPDNLVAKDTTPACDKSDLRHLIGLQLVVQGQWGNQEAPLAHAVGSLARAHLLQAGAAAPGWRMLAQSNDRGSQYEQVLTGSGEQALPWQAVLSIAPVGPEAGAAAPFTDLKTWWRENTLWGEAPTVVRLQLSLAPQGLGRSVFEVSAAITVSARPASAGSRELPLATREQVARQIGLWTQQLADKLACEQVKPEVVQARGADLRINVGALAGVRAGDEWLLADQRRFPQQILEPGVAGQAVLARVQRVYAHHAQLQVLAGPGDQIRTNWRAWQSQSLLSPDGLR
jgi:hypothetical protein